VARVEEGGTVMVLKPIDYDKHFVIGTPLVGWKCEKGEDRNWLQHGARIKERFPNAVFFAALELDIRGIDPFRKMITELQELGGTYWTYMINDNEEEVTSSNRWIRIETGRNLVREFAQRKRVMQRHYWGDEVPQYDVVNYDAILYVDSDIELTPEIIEKLLEVDRPLVGVHVPQYNLRGPVVCGDPLIEEHWTTAGMLLVNAPAYYDLPWSHNAYMNLSDDPTFQNHSLRLDHGMTWVRKDIHAQHRGHLAVVENRQIPKRVHSQ
jgi:hypothetical protein